MGQEKSNNKSSVVSPAFIIQAIRAKWATVLIYTIVVGILGFLVSIFLITPKYSSTVDLLVNQKTDNTQQQFTVQQADLQAINTYKDVIKKTVVLGPVLNNAKRKNNYGGSLNQLEKSVSINNQTNSQVISVSVSDKNPYVASDIANSIGSIFTTKIKKMMKVDNVTIVSKAKPSSTPFFPSKKLFTIFGLFLGLVTGLCVVISEKYFDRTVKNTEFLTNDLGIVSLGEIYHINENKRIFNIVNIIEKNPLKDSHYSERRRV